jgi:hypothetical protein
LLLYAWLLFGEGGGEPDGDCDRIGSPSECGKESCCVAVDVAVVVVVVVVVAVSGVEPIEVARGDETSGDSGCCDAEAVGDWYGTGW